MIFNLRIPVNSKFLKKYDWESMYAFFLSLERTASDVTSQNILD